MSEEKSVLRAIDAEAILLAKTLIRTARHGSLAVIGADGAPAVSRVGVSSDADGVPVILVSGLAPHSSALLNDPRCSLMLGAVGKGDPLAHARISIAARAAPVERGSADHKRIAARYLSHQPKAALYAGLGDFRYLRLEPGSASLNGGFGRAYAMAAEDVSTVSAVTPALAEMEMDAIAHMNTDHAEAVGLYARHFASAPDGKWVLAGIDVEGFELFDGDDMRRVFFAQPLVSAVNLRMMLVDMAKTARAAVLQSN
jgi:putative heme iron utilization protein